MGFILKITNRPRYELSRLTLALAELCKSLASREGSVSKIGFVPFSQAAAEARRSLQQAGPGLAGLLSALENAGARLKKVAIDLDVHGLKPDAESAEALLFIAVALRLQAEFIARPSDVDLLPDAARHRASASRGLRLAARAAKADTGNFIPNLKFCTIYEDLEETVTAVETYAELLARTLSPLN